MSEHSLLQVSVPDQKYRKATNGSTLAAVLSCGRVAFIMAIAGSESLTQIYGMLAAACTRRSLKFVVYDNACALGRFVRGLARRRSTSSATAAVSSNLLYVLDRWHEHNHSACLDPGHVLYMPEVWSCSSRARATCCREHSTCTSFFLPFSGTSAVARRSSSSAGSVQPAAAAKPLLKRSQCGP